MFIRRLGSIYVRLPYPTLHKVEDDLGEVTKICIDRRNPRPTGTTYFSYWVWFDKYKSFTKDISPLF